MVWLKKDFERITDTNVSFWKSERRTNRKKSSKAKIFSAPWKLHIEETKTKVKQSKALRSNVQQKCWDKLKQIVLNTYSVRERKYGKHTSLDQATKSTGWMPRRQLPKKDVVSCDKPWGIANEYWSMDFRMGEPAIKKLWHHMMNP